MKKIVGFWLISFLSGVEVFYPTPVYAEVQTAIVDVGNTICPVSEDKVSGKHFVEYEGKRYGLCCKHCEKEFKKDPEKFIASLGESGEHPHGEHAHEGHSH